MNKFILIFFFLPSYGMDIKKVVAQASLRDAVYFEDHEEVTKLIKKRADPYGYAYSSEESFLSKVIICWG